MSFFFSWSGRIQFFSFLIFLNFFLWDFHFLIFFFCMPASFSLNYFESTEKVKICSRLLSLVVASRVVLMWDVKVDFMRVLHLYLVKYLNEEIRQSVTSLHMSRKVIPVSGQFVAVSAPSCFRPSFSLWLGLLFLLVVRVVVVI